MHVAILRVDWGESVDGQYSQSKRSGEKATPRHSSFQGALERLLILFRPVLEHRW